MSESFVVDGNLYSAPAFAGMLADIQFTSKETFPCGANPVPFGVMTTPNASTGITQVGGTGVGGGVGIHDHIIAAIYQANEYRQFDAISMIRRGRIWCKASGACTKGAVAKFNATTGVFGDAEANTAVNARFRTANVTMPTGLPGDTSAVLVLVEFHDPAVDAVV